MSARNAHAVAARMRKAGAHSGKRRPDAVADDYYEEYLAEKAEAEEERNRLILKYLNGGGTIKVYAAREKKDGV